MKNGQLDTSVKLQEGLNYNYNGQLVVFDGKRLVPYQEYISNR